MMRRILALAVTLFAALASNAASAGSYTFNVQLNTQEVWSNNWNNYASNGVSDSFQFTLTTDSSQRYAYTDNSYYWYGGYSSANEPTTNATTTPYTASLLSNYVGQPPYTQGNYAQSWSYGYYGTTTQFSTSLNGYGGNYGVDIYLGYYTGGYIDFTAPGALDAYFASLVGTSFNFQEHGNNNDGQTLYRGTATLVSTTDVPEPHAMLVVGAGMLVASALRRRRNAAL